MSEKVINFEEAAQRLMERAAEEESVDIQDLLDAPDEDIEVDAATAALIQSRLNSSLEMLANGHANFIATLAALQGAYDLEDAQIARHIEEVYGEVFAALKMIAPKWAWLLQEKYGDDPVIS